MFLDHRPSSVSFKKGLYLTRSSICLRAAALGQSVPWESFLALVAFLLAFSLGSVAVLRKLSVERHRV